MNTFGRILLYGVAILLLLFLSLAWWKLLSVLPLGWIHFLKRNLTQLTIDKSMIFSGVVFSLLLLGFGHFFARWIWSCIPSTKDSPSRWRWKWSFCAYAVIWVLFAITISTAGLYYQTGWLLKVRDSWFQERVSSYYEFRLVNSEVEQWLIRTDRNLDAMRKVAASSPNPRPKIGQSKLLADEFSFLFFGQKTNGVERVAAYLVIPRRGPLLANGDFGLMDPNLDPTIVPFPLAELPATIARLDARYPSPYEEGSAK